MTTRNVERARWRSFLAKAESFLRAARRALEDEDWDPSVSASIHAGILACDVATVGMIGIRNAGQHDEIEALLGLALPASAKEIVDAKRRISRLLSVKNVAEYEARLLAKADAEAALKDAERMVLWATELAKRFP